jgi:hypothetical protein
MITPDRDFFPARFRFFPGIPAPESAMMRRVEIWSVGQVT